MDTIIFLTLILATWRIGNLLTYEDGPAEILSTFRYWVGIRYKAEPPFERYGRNIIAKGIMCLWCNTVWIGLFFTVLYILWNPSWFIALPFAISAGAIYLDGLWEDED